MQMPDATLSMLLNITQPLMNQTGQLRWAINNVAGGLGLGCRLYLGSGQHSNASATPPNQLIGPQCLHGCRHRGLDLVMLQPCCIAGQVAPPCQALLDLVKK